MKQEKPRFEVKDLSGMLSRAKKVATEDATVEVTNLFINAFNAQFDPLDWLDQLPLPRVVHVHLAGGTREGDYHQKWVG